MGTGGRSRGAQLCAPTVLALDVGGTKLEVGVITTGGELLASVVQPTDTAASPRDIVKTLLTMAGEASARAAVTPAAVGVSYGGPVDFPAGKTVTCHHLTGWEGVPLRDWVAEATGRPVVMDNDANAAALGEARFGAAQGCPHVLYLTVSTGIGAGLVLNGQVHRGATSQAGELGHVLVAPEGPVCTCGRRGCLEAVAAGPAIARAAREAVRGLSPNCPAPSSHQSNALSNTVTVRDLPPEAITAKTVAEAAATDPLAARVMAQAGRYLGLAIAMAVNLVNPSIVVIGGGVSQAGDCLFGPVRETVAAYGVPESVRDLRIVPGALGAKSALYGAAALAMEVLGTAEGG